MWRGTETLRRDGASRAKWCANLRVLTKICMMPSLLLAFLSLPIHAAELRKPREVCDPCWVGNAAGGKHLQRLVEPPPSFKEVIRPDKRKSLKENLVGAPPRF